MISQIKQLNKILITSSLYKKEIRNSLLTNIIGLGIIDVRVKKLTTPKGKVVSKMKITSKIFQMLVLTINMNLGIIDVRVKKLA